MSKCRGPLEIPRQNAYHPQMSFFRDASPKGSVSDLIAFLRTPRQHRWLLAVLACAPPAFIVLLFNLDLLQVSKPGEPEVTYIESWSADRSIEEIVESNIARQKQKEEQEARVREAYKALGRATGMDVERIEREGQEARAKRAAEAAAAAAGASK
jgi:hypothetical protein